VERAVEKKVFLGSDGGGRTIPLKKEKKEGEHASAGPTGGGGGDGRGRKFSGGGGLRQAAGGGTFATTITEGSEVGTVKNS